MTDKKATKKKEILEYGIKHIPGRCCPDYNCLYGSWNGYKCNDCGASCYQCDLNPRSKENGKIIEKLLDVLSRNLDTYELRKHYDKSYDVIGFKIRTAFTSTDLKYIFDYTETPLEKIKEWQIKPNSRTTLSISIFLNKTECER